MGRELKGFEGRRIDDEMGAALACRRIERYLLHRRDERRAAAGIRQARKALPYVKLASRELRRAREKKTARTLQAIQAWPIKINGRRLKCCCAHRHRRRIPAQARRLALVATCATSAGVWPAVKRRATRICVAISAAKRAVTADARSRALMRGAPPSSRKRAMRRSWLSKRRYRISHLSKSGRRRRRDDGGGELLRAGFWASSALAAWPGERL